MVLWFAYQWPHETAFFAQENGGWKKEYGKHFYANRGTAFCFPFGFSALPLGSLHTCVFDSHTTTHHERNLSPKQKFSALPFGSLHPCVFDSSHNYTS
jgi:hypothetical protein